MPVLSLSNQKEIALEVSVSNAGGDDAYEASMIASFPSSLTYSATRLLNKVSVSDTLSLTYTDTHFSSDLDLLLISGKLPSQ